MLLVALVVQVVVALAGKEQHLLHKEMELMELLTQVAVLVAVLLVVMVVKV
jgi:hypothetical protein